MSIPLMILGPGGDYQTRYEPSGRELMRRVGPPQEHPDGADTESAGSWAGFAHQRRRRRREEPQNAPRQADRFEITGPPIEPSGGDSTRRWVKSGSLLAAAAAVEAWLAQQDDALRRAADGVRQLAAVAAPLHPQAPLAKVAPAMRRAAPELTDHAIWRRINNDARAVFGDGPSSPETEHAQAHAQATRCAAAHPRLAVDARLFADPAGTRRRAGRHQGHRLRARRGADPQGGAAPRSQQGTLFGAVA